MVYDFDPLGRLNSIDTVDYAYDGLDRVSDRDGIGFTYQGFGLDPTGDGTHTYSRSPAGQLVGISDGTTSLLAGVDRHGDLTHLHQPNGTVTDTALYDPYGDPLSTTGSFDPRVGYQADWTDPATGHVWMGARWYEGGWANFLSRDSVFGELSTPVSLNRYTYAWANPLAYWDPTGQFTNIADGKWFGDGGGTNKQPKAKSDTQIERDWVKDKTKTTTASSKTAETKQVQTARQEPVVFTPTWRDYMQAIDSFNSHHANRRNTTGTGQVWAETLDYVIDEVRTNLDAARDYVQSPDANPQLKRLYQAALQQIDRELTSGAMVQVGVGAYRSSSEYLSQVGNALLAVGTTTAIGNAYIASRITPAPIATPAPQAISAGDEVASSAAQGARLGEHLRLTERYGAGGVRELADGRIRYYGDLTPAAKPGEMAGARLVREWNPAADRYRTWYETLDQAGRVRQVHPYQPHSDYHYRFDEFGNYGGRQ